MTVDILHTPVQNLFLSLKIVCFLESMIISKPEEIESNRIYCDAPPIGETFKTVSSKRLENSTSYSSIPALIISLVFERTLSEMLSEYQFGSVGLI